MGDYDTNENTCSTCSSSSASNTTTSTTSTDSDDDYDDDGYDDFGCELPVPVPPVAGSRAYSASAMQQHNAMFAGARRHTAKAASNDNFMLRDGKSSSSSGGNPTGLKISYVDSLPLARTNPVSHRDASGGGKMHAVAGGGGKMAKQGKTKGISKFKKDNCTIS